MWSYLTPYLEEIPEAAAIYIYGNLRYDLSYDKERFLGWLYCILASYNKTIAPD